MRLRAKVTKAYGPSTNYLGTIEEDKLVRVEQLPNPAWLEISEEGGSFFLLYLDDKCECFADTWHQTLESAQREALLSFGITAGEWQEI